MSGAFSTYIAKPFAVAGLVAYCSMIVIVFTSLAPVRKATYHLFKVCTPLRLVTGVNHRLIVRHVTSSASSACISASPSMSTLRFRLCEWAERQSSVLTTVSPP